jgi:glycosyltransferase involved in cell wall biosynthesis
MTAPTPSPAPARIVINVPRVQGGVRNVTESLAAALRELGVDVVLAHTFREVIAARLGGAHHAILSVGAGLLACLFPRCVYILHGFPVHGFYSAPKRIAVRWVARLAVLCGARTVAVSYLVRAVYDRLYGIRVDEVVFNGCSAAFHRLRAAGLPSPERAVIFVGRWVVTKRVPLAIEAFLASDLPTMGWSMRVVGSGPQEAEVRALASRSSQVEVVGPVEEEVKAALMARSSIFVSLSDLEPMGVVFVEAMLAGCAIVGPHFGGHREFIPPGYPLHTCDPASVPSIAAAMNAAARQAVRGAPVDSRQFDYRESIAPAYLAALGRAGSG